MIIPDLNLLIYGCDARSRFHKGASKWWVGCIPGNTPVGASPTSVDQAAAEVESWLERRNVRIVNPGPRHAELLFGFLRIESRAVIHTADTDFLRVSGVRWLNPLD